MNKRRRKKTIKKSLQGKPLTRLEREALADHYMKYFRSRKKLWRGNQTKGD